MSCRTKIEPINKVTDIHGILSEDESIAFSLSRFADTKKGAENHQIQSLTLYLLQEIMKSFSFLAFHVLTVFCMVWSLLHFLYSTVAFTHKTVFFCTWNGLYSECKREEGVIFMP